VWCAGLAVSSFIEEFSFWGGIRISAEVIHPSVWREGTTADYRLDPYGNR